MKLYFPGEGISNRSVQTSSWKYVSLAPAFSVGKSTVIEAVQDTVNTLFDLQNQYVKFPTTEAETEECTASFNQTLSELPNVTGTIDFTHIQIIAPRVNPVDFFSRYKQLDIIVQGIVDGTGKFIDLFIFQAVYMIRGCSEIPVFTTQLNEGTYCKHQR